MDLLIIILNKLEFLNDLLSCLVEADITNATILDSEQLASRMAHEIPIFADLKQILGADKSYNKMIFGIIEEKSTLQELGKYLKEAQIDFSDPEVGTLLTIPIISPFKS